MFTSRNFKALLLLAASLLFLHSDAAAQSGRKSRSPGTIPGIQSAPTTPPADSTHYDKVKVVVAHGLEDFVKALNEQGRLGYRLEKTVNYGDPKRSRNANESLRYAAVLHLDPGHSYDYVSDPVWEDSPYSGPLNYYPGRGYGLAHAYAVTQCRLVDVYDYNAPPESATKQEFQAEKGNVLLFMRRDAADTQTKEYRAFKGRFSLDGGQKQELQAALDAAPPGFRPVRILFSQSGLYIFNVTVVAERDLNEVAPPRVEYQLVKEVFGFEDEVNRLAAAGSRYVGGGRIDSLKFAVLARQAGGATAYTFKDDHQYRKEFPRMVAAGNSYVGLQVGDLTCDSDSALVSQKLVFERDAGGARARAYRVLQLSDHKTAKKPGVLSNSAVNELQHLLGEGFRVRDIFYNYGLYVILERQTGSPAAQEQTSAR
jgi:hypothetical protein